MSITLYTPATGFPDLEIKIAYGLARVGIEAWGMDKVSIQNSGGFYTVTIDANEGELDRLDSTFNMLCKRLLSSPYIPFSTPGITGKSAENIAVKEEEIFKIDYYKSIQPDFENRKSDNCCRHDFTSVGNIIGFAASTSFHNRRDGLDVQLQYKNPKDKTSPKLPRRPTNPTNICKQCAMLSLLGTWYASFIFGVSGRETIVLPMLKGKIDGLTLQAIFSLQHQLRKSWFNQEVPQVIIPLVFLSKIPSSADILENFDLFMAVLSRQKGYHVDGLYLIPIERYLNFIKESPYNIAMVERMLGKEAYASLTELNKAIYYKDASSLPKFARLYVQETSSADWVNLLYLETAKYLLKEVAMIKPEIIKNPAIASVARTLRYFIRERNYGYADNIRNAKKESREFEETVAKMLREGRLRLEQKEMIHLPTEEDVKELFRLAESDFEATKLALVILAFSFPAKGEEADKKEEEEAQNA